MSRAQPRACQRIDLAPRAAGRCRTEAGLTLIELMITIAIMAILLTLAAPSFRTLLMNNRLNGQVNALFNGLNYARSTALSTSNTITVCPFNTQTPPACAGTNWSVGWMVVDLSDPNPANHVVLLSSTASANGPTLTSVLVPGATSVATSVVFDSRGLASTLAGFMLCDSRVPPYANSVMVMATGSVLSGSSATTATGPGSATAVWGGNLTCPNT